MTIIICYEIKFTDMLSASVGSMKPTTFAALPSSTNAVESLHRGAKGKQADVLRVALMSTYKVDMASTLEYIAATKHIPTSYERLTPSVRKQRAKVAEKARVKRMREDDDVDGPPDKRRHFGNYNNSLRVHTYSYQLKYYKACTTCA